MTEIEPGANLVRAFIALEINDEVRRGLTALQNTLRMSRAHVGWVDASKIHLTLAFLGDIQPFRIQELSVGLDAIAAEASPFECEAAGVGSFGGHRPKVLWVGVQAGGDRLSELQRRVADMVAAAGLTLEEREFHAHLTVGRIRSPRGAEELIRAMDAAKEKAFGAVRVERILLIRSVLRSGGPEYSVLHESRFKGGAG